MDNLIKVIHDLGVTTEEFTETLNQFLKFIDGQIEESSNLKENPESFLENKNTNETVLSIETVPLSNLD